MTDTDTPAVVRARLDAGRHIADADIHALVGEIDRLRFALRQIGAVGYGLDTGDTIEEHANYWHVLAERYRRIARDALGK